MVEMRFGHFLFLLALRAEFSRAPCLILPVAADGHTTENPRSLPYPADVHAAQAVSCLWLDTHAISACGLII
jgi:hypothetical protein